MSKVNKPGTYKLSVIDNKVDADLQLAVYNYLLDSEYCVNFYDHNHSLWYPREDKWVFPRTKQATLRLPLAWDEESLKIRAPVIYQLWTVLSDILDNQYEIKGSPEGMRYMTGISPLSSLTKSDGTPGYPNCAWRVYGSGHSQEYKTQTKSIHRDSIDLNDDSEYTLVYFANQDWHPQFYGETLFHSNDSVTGDFTGKFDNDQLRNYPVGEVENVVAPGPGRIMLFDGRYLHQVKPVATYSPEPTMGIVFRIKLKK
jgi:hypothetical protein